MSAGTTDVADWWRTSIVEMEPGRIALRGHEVQDLIGHVSFATQIWLMLRGDLPTEGQARLLEATLVAAVDHGPQAPSIAAARMSVTCGAQVQSAMATGVGMLGDVHGGAGQQAVALYRAVDASSDLEGTLAKWRAENGKYVPGFGHRFHPVDPRAPCLMALAEAGAEGFDPRFARIARAIEAHLTERAGRPVPMNIDGATAAIHAGLGFDGEEARGLFVLSRSVGILAHALEQRRQGGRNKGPTPPRYGWTHEPGGQVPREG